MQKTYKCIQYAENIQVYTICRKHTSVYNMQKTYKYIQYAENIQVYTLHNTMKSTGAFNPPHTMAQ